MGSKIRAKNCNLYEREFINFPRGASIREKGVHLNCLKRFNVQEQAPVSWLQLIYLMGTTHPLLNFFFSFLGAVKFA